MAISPRLPRRKLYTFFEINFFFIGKGHFAFFERYVRGNIHCSFYAHWKARSGLPISDNWTFFRQMLMDCPELRDVRLKYFTASSLKDIFESIDNQTFIDFIKDVNFYHQLYLLSAFYSSYSILVLFINHFFTDFTIILHFYFQSPSCYSIFMVAK